MCPNVTCLRWFYTPPPLSPYPTLRVPLTVYFLADVHTYGGGVHPIHQSSVELWNYSYLLSTKHYYIYGQSTVGYCRTHRKFSWGCAVKAAARYLNINFMRHFLQRTFDSENDKLSKFSKIATKIQLLSDNCERTWFFYNILSISSQLVMNFKPFTKITYL